MEENNSGLLLRTSLKGLTAAVTYRASFKLHLTILSSFILAQPVLAYFEICSKRVALVTALVNLPTLIMRCAYHTWEDAESAQRAGAPMARPTSGRTTRRSATLRSSAVRRT